MENTFEAIAAQYQELDTQKTQLETKLSAAQNSMAELQSRYRKAAADVALGAKKPAEQPAEVQVLIGKQQIIVDGLETALAQCVAQWHVVRQEYGILSQELSEQREREAIQAAINAAITHGDAMLKCHEVLQTHFANLRSIEGQLRGRNLHAAAERILETLRTRPNFFGRGLWDALVAVQPWDVFTADNVRREASYREMRGEKSAST